MFGATFNLVTRVGLGGLTSKFCCYFLELYAVVHGKVVFGTLKDSSLQINSLASNNCFS